MKQAAKYRDIISWAEEQFAKRAFKPGDLFLSESALSEQFGFSRQTVRRAMEVMEERGYITRMQGRGSFVNDIKLHADKQAKPVQSMTVGIVTPYVDNYIFPSIVFGAENVLTECGINMQLAFTKNTISGEMRALQLMLNSDLDGMLIWATKSGLPCVNMDMYHTIQHRGIPFVFVDSYYPAIPAPHIMLDDEQAGYIATKYLLSMGHRNIACILRHNVFQGHLRYQGYIKALFEAGIPVWDENIFWCSKESMYVMLDSRQLMEALSGCTAVFCYNDQLAIELIDRLKRNGRRIPEDISVVGVDNSDLAPIYSLTSIVHPKERLGEAAARMLLTMLKGSEGSDILFKPELIERSSVKKID